MMPRNDDDVTTRRWEFDKVKMNLTAEQIDASAAAILKAAKVDSWHQLSFTERENWQVMARAAAPFLQMPWELPTQSECELIRRAQDVAEVTVHYAVSSFINMRNASLIPKPADPRREKIEKIVISELGKSVLQMHGKGEYIIESGNIADRILAALDAKE
jgi:hypothetical protein